MAVAVPNGKELTSAELGFDCDITHCENSESKNFKIGSWSANINVNASDFVDCQLYFVDCDEVVSESEAYNLCDKLVENKDIYFATPINVTYSVSGGIEAIPENDTNKNVKICVSLKDSSNYEIDVNSELYSYLTSIGCTAPQYDVNTTAYGTYVYLNIPLSSVNYTYNEYFHSYKPYSADIYQISEKLKEFNEIECAYPSLTFLCSTPESVITFGTDEAVLTGDTNQDGLVNIADGVFLSKHIADATNYAFKENGEKAADVYADGVIDFKDLASFIKMLAEN